MDFKIFAPKNIKAAVGAAVVVPVAAVALAGCSSDPQPTVQLRSPTDASQYLEHAGTGSLIEGEWNQCITLNPQQTAPSTVPASLRDGVSGLVSIANDDANAKLASCVSTALSNEATALGEIPKPKSGEDATAYNAAKHDIPILKEGVTYQGTQQAAARAQATTDGSALDATLVRQAPASADGSGFLNATLGAQVASSVRSHTVAPPPAASEPNAPGVSQGLLDATRLERDAARQTVIAGNDRGIATGLNGVVANAQALVPTRPGDTASEASREGYVAAALDANRAASTQASFDRQGQSEASVAQSDRSQAQSLISAAAPNLTSSADAGSLFFPGDRTTAQSQLRGAETAPVPHVTPVITNYSPSIDGASLSPALTQADLDLITWANQNSAAARQTGIANAASNLASNFRANAGTIAAPGGGNRDAADVAVVERLADAAAASNLATRDSANAASDRDAANAANAAVDPLARTTVQGAYVYRDLTDDIALGNEVTDGLSRAQGSVTRYYSDGSVYQQGSGLLAYQQDITQAQALMQWMIDGGSAPAGAPYIQPAAGSQYVTYAQIGQRLNQVLGNIQTDGLYAGNQLANENADLASLGLPHPENRTASTYNANLSSLRGFRATDWASLGAKKDAGTASIYAPSGWSSVMSSLAAGPTVDTGDVRTLTADVTTAIRQDQRRQTSMVNGAPGALRGAFTLVNS